MSPAHAARSVISTSGRLKNPGVSACARALADEIADRPGGVGIEGRLRLGHGVAERDVRRLLLAVDLQTDRLELLVQHQAIGRTLGRVLVEQPANQVVEIVRHLRSDPAHAVELSVAVLVEQIEERVAVERRPAREHLVEDDAERVDVAPLGRRLAGRLFGGDVLGAADDAARLREAGAGEDLGDAEVGQLEDAIVADEDVRRLEIAMDDAVIVDMLEGRADLEGDVDGVAPRELAAHVDEVVEPASLDELHGVPVMPVLVAGVVELDDVRMRELGERLDLAFEALEEAGVLGEIGGEDLEGGLSAGDEFLGEMDASHAAAPDLAREDPAAESFAHHRGASQGDDVSIAERCGGTQGSEPSTRRSTGAAVGLRRRRLGGDRNSLSSSHRSRRSCGHPQGHGDSSVAR